MVDFRSSLSIGTSSPPWVRGTRSPGWVLVVLVHLQGEHFRKTRSPGWSRSKKRHFRAPERTKVHEERRIMTLMKRLAKLVNGYWYMRSGEINPDKEDVPLW